MRIGTDLEPANAWQEGGWKRAHRQRKALFGETPDSTRGTRRSESRSAPGRFRDALPGTRLAAIDIAKLREIAQTSKQRQNESNRREG